MPTRLGQQFGEPSTKYCPSPTNVSSLRPNDDSFRLRGYPSPLLRKLSCS